MIDVNILYYINVDLRAKKKYKLTSNDVVILGFMANRFKYFKSIGRPMYDSVEDIAEALDISKATILRSIKTLVGHGLIAYTQEQQGSKFKNIYTFVAGPDDKPRAMKMEQTLASKQGVELKSKETQDVKQEEVVEEAPQEEVKQEALVEAPKEPLDEAIVVINKMAKEEVEVALETHTEAPKVECDWYGNEKPSDDHIIDMDTGRWVELVW